MQTLSSVGTLLSIEDSLVPADSKTVRSFAFDVPAGTAAMTLAFEWTPSVSTDEERNRAAVLGGLAQWRGPSVLGDEGAPLGAMFEQADVKRCLEKLPNLLNTVLVEPNGRWRGRSDRGKGTRQKPLLIDPDQPGPGFCGGAIEPGVWRVDLEVHAVVSERCDFFLEVKSVQVSEPAIPAATSTGALFETRGPGWYRGELHTHTRHSDGSHTVTELTRRAKALGLDFIALTDHNCTAGERDLAGAHVPVILGAELTTFRGHHVVLGLDDMEPWHRDGQVLDVNDVVRRVKAQGALFTLTHPFNLGDPICTGCRWMTPELDRSQVDLVEIWHRRWTGDSAHNPAARALWDELWQQGHRPTAIAVRDWHSGQHEDDLPGPLPTTVVFAQSTAPSDLLEGLRAGRVYVTRGPAIDFTLTDGGTPLGIGERAPASGDDVIARVRVPEGGHAGAGRLELYRRGVKVSEASFDGSESYELTATGGPGHYRVELWDDDGPLVITNHVELLAR